MFSVLLKVSKDNLDHKALPEQRDPKELQVSKELEVAVGGTLQNI